MLNVVVLIGRLCADPEVSTTSSGIMRAKFRLAVNRNFKNQQGEVETDFINIIAWRKTAELCGQYVKKGYLVAVDGRLEVREYQTPEGETRRAFEVVAEDVRFLDRGGRAASGEAAAPPPTEPSFGPASPEDDSLPF